MKDELAKRYLQEYFDETDSLFESYMATKIKEASRAGNLPKDLLKRFTEIAKKGKKIRGALVVLGYELAGGKDLEAIYDTSLFIELIHAGLLVHDDIMDRDTLRRGQPTLHVQYKPSYFGLSMAINAGDIAFYLGWEKLFEGRFKKDALIKAAKIIASYLTRVGYGQVLDVENVTMEVPSQKHILTILRYKTAEYSGVLPLLVGAILGGLDDKKRLQRIKEYGLCLGWTFQIQDDILGTFGDEKETGKPTDSDLKEKKGTLLLAHFLTYANKNQKDYLKKVLKGKNISETTLSKVRQMFKQAGSYEHAVQLAKKYVSEGKRIIPEITTDRRLQNILESFLIYVLTRTR